MRRYETAVNQLNVACQKLATYVNELSAKNFEFKKISHNQTYAPNSDVVKWSNAGKNGAAPHLSTLQGRAIIFATAEETMFLKGYLVSYSVIVGRLLHAASLAYENSDLTQYVSCLRGVIERIAFMNRILKVLEENRQSSKNGEMDIEAYRNANGELAKLLYGTNKDWAQLATVDLRSLKPRDVAFQAKDGFISMSPGKLMQKIDDLNKMVAGIRVVYEVFCEFLHPNVGDLISSTLFARSETDQTGVRRTVRVIGNGKSCLDATPEIAGALARCFEIMAEAVDYAHLCLEQMETHVATSERLTKSRLRLLIRRHKHVFEPGEACPCYSGQLVSRCCGKLVTW